MTDKSDYHFLLPQRVYIEDTDAGGIVYYVNYLKFMERARTEFMRSLGFEQKLGPYSQSQFVVHSVDMKFLQPARMDMLVIVSLTLLKRARSYFIVEQHVLDEQKKTIFCSAQIKIACVSNENFKPMAMPDKVVSGLKSFL